MKLRPLLVSMQLLGLQVLQPALAFGEPGELDEVGEGQRCQPLLQHQIGMQYAEPS
jgi:hypothetical protein